MAHIERAGGAGNRDVDYHIALGQQLVAEAVTLTANDESNIFW